jgi:hypothetical protein
LPLPSIRFRLAAPDGGRFTALRRVPDGEEVAFSLDEAGDLRAEIRDLELFDMLDATYEVPR